MDPKEPMCCKAVCCSSSQTDGNPAAQEEQRNISSLKRAGCIRPTSKREVASDGNGNTKGVDDRLLCALGGRSRNGELKQRSMSKAVWKF